MDPNTEQVLVVAAVVLFAVLVGAAVPVLLQLRRTLRTAETFLDTTGRRLNHALDEAAGTAAKLRLAADHIEAGAADLRRLLESASGLADSLGELRDSLPGVSRAAAAIGPAIAGAIHALAGRFTAGARRASGKSRKRVHRQAATGAHDGSS